MKLFLSLCAGLIVAGCSSVTIQDTHRGVSFSARVPAWPWQDSQKALDRMTLSARGTNFSASLRGLSESETFSPAIVEALTRIESIVSKMRIP